MKSIERLSEKKFNTISDSEIDKINGGLSIKRVENIQDGKNDSTCTYKSIRIQFKGDFNFSDVTYRTISDHQ